MIRYTTDQLKITTQVIRDGTLARQLHYEQLHNSKTPDMNTVRQIMGDQLMARKLQKYEQLGYHDI